jgi:diacylglycerol O-acyltransferase
MTGFDAAFIYDERPEETQHTLKISIWSPRASECYSLERTRRWIRGRLRELPPLRWRSVRVPFDLHHPVWIDGGEIDVARHVKRLVVPAPAGRRELCELISEIASQPLDPSRQLWELWMLEGYEGDKVVALLKMSHALADGGECKALLERLYSEAAVEELPEDSAPLEGEPLPSRRVLLRDALRDCVLDLTVHLPRLVRAHREARRRLREAPIPTEYEGPRAAPFGGPWIPFSGPLSRRRTFYFTTLALDDAKEIRRTLGCTINDVVLATTAGAVRRYLRHRDALPGLPTIAAMPASIRERDEQGHWGNRITSRWLTLPTHIDDPIARLRAASQIASEAKADLALRRGANLEDWLRWLPPFAPKLLSRAMRTLVRLRPEAPAGVAVSNVPGPAVQLQAPGGPVENFISVGHMKYAAGLNTTVWSYAGRLNVGLYTCGEAVPDLWRVADCVNESFEELRKAAAREASRIAA